VAGYCEHGNDILDSIESAGFVGQLGKHQRLKDDSTLRSYLYPQWRICKLLGLTRDGSSLQRNVLALAGF
jgi:hypothetical protein